jgi:hypothetical protein
MSKAHSAAKRSFLRTKKTHSADFSARKPGKKANSPHSNKILMDEQGDAVIYARATGYRGIFEEMPDELWQRVTVLREEFRDAVRKGRAAGHSGSGWTKNQKKARVARAIRGNPVSNNYFSTEVTSLTFVDTFLEAISDPAFPERPIARARFLAESLAGYGEVSARRCRDICSNMRKKEGQRKSAQPELWIKCCGKPRWTVNSVCPECGETPIPIAAFL